MSGENDQRTPPGVETVIQKSARVLRARTALAEIQAKLADIRLKLAEAEDEVKDAEDDLAKTLGSASHASNEESKSDEEDEEGPPGAPKTWQRIVDLINDHPDHSFTAGIVAETLDLDNVPSVRSMLAKLAGKGIIERIGNGKYVAKKGGRSVAD